MAGGRAAHGAGPRAGRRDVVRARLPALAKAALAAVIYGVMVLIVRAIPEELMVELRQAAWVGHVSATAHRARSGLPGRRLGRGGTYARELMPALLEAEPDVRITAFVGRSAPPDIAATPWAVESRVGDVPRVVRLPAPMEPAASPRRRSGSPSPPAAARRRLHVVHGLANVAPVLQPRAATVVTLLDLIWLSYPDTMSRRATLSRRLVAMPSARRGRPRDRRVGGGACRHLGAAGHRARAHRRRASRAGGRRPAPRPPPRRSSVSAWGSAIAASCCTSGRSASTRTWPG